MSPQAKKIERLGTDQPNAMTTSGGDWFYPDGPEDAALLNVEHGATPANLAAWPWPGVAVPPTAADAIRPTCPAPDTCFPNGIDPSWTAVTCAHGAFEL